MIVKSAKGIVLVNNKYLLQLRDNKKQIFYPNFWGLFGGSLNKYENYRNAVEREMKEETNLKVKAVRKILSVNFNVITSKRKRGITYFECKILNKDRIVLNEGKKYEFFSFKQIKKLNIVPMDFVAINSHHSKIKNYTSKRH